MKLKLAIQKSGRLHDGSVKLLQECGIDISNGNNQLRVQAANFPLEVFFLRDDDIPEYVQDAVADIGFVGENVIAEKNKQVISVEKLGFGKCRLSIAIPKTGVIKTVNDLNGKKIATLIGPLYTVTITPNLLKPVNDLQVIVTNGMANRIIDLDKKGVQWKKFYNINMSARLAENRGADGLFTAAKWQPKPSGLLGPVTLTPMKFE